MANWAKTAVYRDSLLCYCNLAFLILQLFLRKATKIFCILHFSTLNRYVVILFNSCSFGFVITIAYLFNLDIFFLLILALSLSVTAKQVVYCLIRSFDSIVQNAKEVGLSFSPYVILIEVQCTQMFFSQNYALVFCVNWLCCCSY